MIVKNEEACLPDCLRSVQSLVDEMIVVDTGSSDKTVEIAGSFGAEVVHYPWNNDFAEARNVSLRHATGDWILVLDADEAVAPEDLARIRQLVQDPDVTGYKLVQRTYSNATTMAEWLAVEHPCPEARGCSGYTPSPYVRLFRRDRDIYFEGKVHEIVEYTISKMGGRIVETDIPIHHYGYISDSDSARRKERLYRGIVEEMEAGSGSAEARSYLYKGIGCIELKEYEDAMVFLKKAETLAPQNAMILFNLGLCTDAQGRSDEAVHYYHLVLAYDPGHVGAYNNLAAVLTREGRLADAEVLYRTALKYNPDHYILHYNLAIFLKNQGRNDEAIAEFQKTLSINPEVAEAHLSSGVLFFKKGDYARARDSFKRVLEIDRSHETAKKNLEVLEEMGVA